MVKISEGSVRDALSLLDRAMLVENNGNELELSKAQEIFGYFEKSMTIDLIKFVLDGDEDNVLKFYRKIYNSGADPKIFINEYLETLYYIKNIDFMNLDETNFDLNDEEFNKIKNLSKNISKKNLLLLWQFTLNNIEKIDIIKNQHQFVEMFLIRSIYLNKILSKNQNSHLTSPKQEATHLNLKEKKDNEIKQDTIDQIKNTEQKAKIITPESEQNKSPKGKS